MHRKDAATVSYAEIAVSDQHALMRYRSVSKPLDSSFPPYEKKQNDLAANPALPTPRLLPISLVAV
jgi:hypothetical protein